jgi:hypothetical protein
MLNFEETVEVLIGDPHAHAAEVEFLRDLVPVAKRNHARHRSRAAALARERYSVDVPVPYRISELVALIDELMGRLDMKKDLAPLRNLKARIETVTQDVRYGFLFGTKAVEDNLKDVLKRLFRMPVAGKPVTVLQLTGLPSEIVNVIVSVLARLAFDVALWGDGKVPMTFVCEEAHRYVPGDARAGFEPAKRALARIAKEGRKYGLSLGIVSQRPGDIDPTILSQCSTLFTMRLSNEQDQQIVRSALSDAARSLLDFLPSLGTRETIIFGEGVSLPSRVLLSKLPANARPKGHGNSFTSGWAHDIGEDDFLDEIISRWRAAGQPGTEASDAGKPRSATPGDATNGADATPAGPSGPRNGEAFGRKPAPQPAPGDKEVHTPALDRLAQRLRSMQD